MQTKNHYLFSCIKRAKRDYIAFSEEYSLDEIDHFDCCMYSQNFAFIIKQINDRLFDLTFMKENFFLEDILLKELNFFVSLKEIIEKKRMEKSIVKISINAFLFSEN